MYETTFDLIEKPQSKWSKAAMIQVVKNCCNANRLRFDSAIEEMGKDEIFNLFFVPTSQRFLPRGARSYELYGIDDFAVEEYFEMLSQSEYKELSVRLAQERQAVKIKQREEQARVARCRCWKTRRDVYKEAFRTAYSNAMPMGVHDSCMAALILIHAELCTIERDYYHRELFCFPVGFHTSPTNRLVCAVDGRTERNLQAGSWSISDDVFGDDRGEHLLNFYFVLTSLENGLIQVVATDGSLCDVVLGQVPITARRMEDEGDFDLVMRTVDELCCERDTWGRELDAAILSIVLARQDANVRAYKPAREVWDRLRAENALRSAAGPAELFEQARRWTQEADQPVGIGSTTMKR